MPVDFIALQQKIVILVFSKIESSYNPIAYNEKEGAGGLLQIKCVMLHHINKICKTNYTLQNCFDSLKSTQMFFHYQEYYSKELNIEQYARRWVGGDNGMNKRISTQPYYERIRKEFIKVASKEMESLNIQPITIFQDFSQVNYKY